MADGLATVFLSGRFDFSAQRNFSNCLDSQMANPAVKEIRIDFAHVEYLDSSALGMLLLAKERMENERKKISLTNCSGGVKRILDIANFDRLFAIS